MASLVASAVGLLSPLSRLGNRDALAAGARHLAQRVGPPLLGVLLFGLLWSWASSSIETTLGEIPGPAAVWRQAGVLYAEHQAERQRAATFNARQDERRAALLASNPSAAVPVIRYTGKPTFVDQIVTSLKTVFAGFLVASIVAIPVGILCGMSRAVNDGLNPVIQIFRPVSPLAWLPIVTMVVSAVYVSADPLFEKSFITSAITVALCSLWPTLINTALGVSSIDKDLLNVARVLRLRWPTKLTKIVIPSALPLIFTGLRLSLGVGWMVLIAAEMLAQNPGLGKFVWDEFQNGSADSLGRIMVAVLTIGIIGALLDRVMSAIHAVVDVGQA
jgi:nitrate/nitrite transport system permease protein